MKKIIAVLCGLVLLVGLYGCWPSLLSPVAEFEWTNVGLRVTFDANLSYDSDGNIASYDWQFGDEAIGIGPAPVHVYDDYGSYAVQLTVTDNDGKTGFSTHTVTLVENPIDHSPVANFVWHRHGGFHIDFDGSTSSDEDNDIVYWFWLFGDGDEGSGIEDDHTYDNPGIAFREIVTLTVVDDDGLSDTIQREITFCNSGVQTTSLSVSAPQNEIEIFCHSYDEATGALVLTCENVSGYNLSQIDIEVRGQDAWRETINLAFSSTNVDIDNGEVFELPITLVGGGIKYFDVYGIDVI